MSTLEGSGESRSYRDDACHNCGGSGEIIRGGWPASIRRALEIAEVAR